MLQTILVWIPKYKYKITMQYLQCNDFKRKKKKITCFAPTREEFAHSFQILQLSREYRFLINRSMNNGAKQKMLCVYARNKR